ncbi:NAD-dependent epimerase/dehydratase family protein [Mangrovihabitans endophyticus]|uniref:Reductase n=1 Tax=Mangrovihabitans endophyticus TaxID=1751298 RepID=A0A8J3C387_9ACTN|nr:NAD-dependent epimerase/dehydratase family protein [Mangrovihabitans endophyticus]GGL12128.1 reductase [Mangrovihabitans endophyticus]
MRVLVLGGTGFVGRAVAEAAVAHGHRVTVFNRGRRAPVPGVRAVAGDRAGPQGLAALGGACWDAVVDTWSGAPRVVREAARALRSRVGHYTYVSSRSVYDLQAAAGRLAEDAPLVDGDPDAGADGDYAAAKRGGELAALQSDAPVLLARAGLILGPYEDVGRLPWWLHRMRRGGPVLAPGPRDLPLQLIDARDLARFLLDAASARRSGAFNLVSEPGHTTMGGLLAAVNAVTGGRGRLRWVPPERILAAGIQPWVQLPVWLPPGPEYDFLHRGDVSRAVAAGLRVRPVEQTVADTWAWLRGVHGFTPRPDRPQVGLDPGVEAAVLAGAGG